MEERVDVALLRPGDDADALLGQLADQGRVFRGVGLEGSAIRELSADGAPLDHNVANMPCPDLVQEIGIGDLLCPALRRAARLEQVEERYQKQRHDDPQRQIAAEIVHRFISRSRHDPLRSHEPLGAMPAILPPLDRE